MKIPDGSLAKPSEPEVQRKQEAKTVIVLNHTLHPRTVDVGAINPNAPSVRRVLKVPSGTFDKAQHRVVPGRAEIPADIWADVQKHQVGAKLIEKGIISEGR